MVAVCSSVYNPHSPWLALTQPPVVGYLAQQRGTDHKVPTHSVRESLCNYY